MTSSDPAEISRLQQELASAETARSVLAESVSNLEQERQRAEKSVWMTQGELSALQDQLRNANSKNAELTSRLTELQQRLVSNTEGFLIPFIQFFMNLDFQE